MKPRRIDACSAHWQGGGGDAADVTKCHGGFIELQLEAAMVRSVLAEKRTMHYELHGRASWNRDCRRC
jgi:hypothetical protein